MSLLRCVVAPHRRLFCGFAGAVLLYVVGGRESCRVCNEVYASSSSLYVVLLLLLLLSLQFQNIQQLYTIRHPHTSTFLRYFCFAVVVAHPVIHPILSIQECIVGGIQRRRIVVEQRVKIKLRQAERRLLWLWYGGWAALKAFARLLQRYAGRYSWLEMVWMGGWCCCRS